MMKKSPFEPYSGQPPTSIDLRSKIQQILSPDPKVQEEGLRENISPYHDLVFFQHSLRLAYFGALVRAFKRAEQDPNSNVRYSIIGQLSSLARSEGYDGAMFALYKIAHDENEPLQIRIEAAIDLAQIRDEERFASVNAKLDRYARRFESLRKNNDALLESFEKNPRALLARLLKPKVNRALDMLKNMNPQTRANAAGVLKGFEFSYASHTERLAYFGAVVRMLKGPNKEVDIDVRRSLVEFLGGITAIEAHTGALRELYNRTLDTDEDLTVRYQASHALYMAIVFVGGFGGSPFGSGEAALKALRIDKDKSAQKALGQMYYSLQSLATPARQLNASEPSPPG